MARPKNNRTILAPPLMQGFKPFGIPKRDLETVILSYDEYEAIRLLDYENLTQAQAAEKMDVSRPTLTRIYENARKTIANAFVTGKMILIEGGEVTFEGRWLRCKRCFKLVDEMQNQQRCGQCPTLCKEELECINQPSVLPAQ